MRKLKHRETQDPPPNKWQSQDMGSLTLARTHALNQHATLPPKAKLPNRPFISFYHLLYPYSPTALFR